MKLFLPILILVFFISSCDEDPITITINQPGILTNLNLDNIKTLLPIEQFKTHQYAVYVNAEHEERYLKIFVKDTINQAQYNGIPYNTENVRVTLEDTLNNAYALTCNLQNKYFSFGTFAICSAVLLSGFNNGHFPSVTLDQKGEIIFGILLDSINIANKTFFQVFTDFPDPVQYDSYSKIYFKSGMGFVGFQGEDQEMWAFDRFE